MGTESRPIPAYAAWHELRQFISQTSLNLTPCDDRGYSLYKFKDGTNLIAESREEPLPETLERFARDAAKFIESHDAHIDWEGSGGPALNGTGIERQIVSHELWKRVGIEPESRWTRDIIGILSFLSQTSQRRYEKATPQLTVELDPTSAVDTHYGILGKPLLDEYRALLRLCRDAHTILQVQAGLSIVNILDDIRAGGSVDGSNVIPVPPRLAHLQQRTIVNPSAVVFNLNENGSQEIVADGTVVFRQVNGMWRLVMLREAFQIIRDELGPSGTDNVARNALMLALDLADAAEGALLFLCSSPTTEVLEYLFLPGDGLICSVPAAHHHELGVRARFTQLVGERRLSLKGQSYSRITPLLRDVCGIDGSAIFSYGGDLLGFGCLVRQRADQDGEPAAEGARTSAAKAVSRMGVAIKISSDGTANLFIAGREWGVIW